MASGALRSPPDVKKLARHAGEAPGAGFGHFGWFLGQTRARAARAQKTQIFGGLPKDTALDGSGPGRSRCHGFEAPGEIYNLGPVAEPENHELHQKSPALYQRLDPPGAHLPA